MPVVKTGSGLQAQARPAGGNRRGTGSVVKSALYFVLCCPWSGEDTLIPPPPPRVPFSNNYSKLNITDHSRTNAHLKGGNPARTLDLGGSEVQAEAVSLVQAELQR